MKALICLVFYSCFNFVAYGQTTHAFKYFGITAHPFGDDYAYLQPNKLDKKAYLVLNFGLLYEFEKYFHKDEFSFKYATTILSDCSTGWGAGNMIGVKATTAFGNKQRVGIFLGPLFYIRESWERFSDYENTSKFIARDTRYLGRVQQVFYWCAMTIDYDVRLSKKLDVSFTLTPGIPYVIMFAVGVKYWPTRVFKN